MLEIELSNRQTRHAVDESRLISAARLVLSEAGIRAGEISLAVVDDPEIHAINRRYLQHDYPTDVLSFTLDREDDRLDGEVIVSADTAAVAATKYGWSLNDELLLYIIHGTLHLVGYDDLAPDLQAKMRERERHYLRRYQLELRVEG